MRSLEKLKRWIEKENNKFSKCRDYVGIPNLYDIHFLMLDSYESQTYSFLSCCDNSPHVNLPNGILNNDNRQNDHAPNDKPQNDTVK
jgi:hypothetical protein